MIVDFVASVSIYAAVDETKLKLIAEDLDIAVEDLSADDVANFIASNYNLSLVLPEDGAVIKHPSCNINCISHASMENNS